MPALKRLLVLMVLLPGCVGSGEGWVIGDLTLPQCNRAAPLNEVGSFDLGVSFFAGEALQDVNPSVSQQNHRLTVRLQNASTTIEVSDGLIFQFRDTAQAAKSFWSRKLLPVTEGSLCPGTCPLTEDLVRGRLYLYTSCPDNRLELVAVNRTFTEQTDPSTGQPCEVPGATESPTACGAADPASLAALDALCAGDFSKRDSAPLLRSTLGAGGGSCLYLCRWGDVRREKPVPEGYAIDYGQTVAALFSLRIVDGRAIRSASCAQGQGQVQGMFNFTVRRGTNAQPFP